MRLHILIAPAIALFLVTPEMQSDLRAAFSRIDPRLASTADTITAVFADSRWSHLEFGKESSGVTPLPPPGERYEILSPRLSPFGRCGGGDGVLRRTGRGACGFIVDLRIDGAPLDLLAFDSLELHGSWTGRWRLAIADEQLRRQDDNVSLKELGFGHAVRVRLADVAGSLDLQRTDRLVLLLESRHGSIIIDRITFVKRPPVPEPHPPPAIWIWDGKQVIASPHKVIDDIAAIGVRRVYLQIGDDTGLFRPFLVHCRDRGVEVYALDGYPSAPLEPEPLLKRAAKVADHNRRFPSERFAGFQIDVEPHLAPDFRLRPDDYGRRMIALAAQIKEIIAPLPLSIVLPFWYDSLTVENRSLSWHLLRACDEAVVMSYRTDREEQLRLAREELLTGEKLGKPVRIGIETVRLPDELHIVYRRCPPSSADAIPGGGDFWCRRSEFEVKGNRLSF